MLSNDNPVQLRWPAKFNEVPKEAFHREDVYRLELERIFRGPEWHPLAHKSELPNVGDYKTGYIGETPVLVVHGDDGNIRVFSNSCPHRGTQLKTCSRGHAAEIECPYHRWVFNIRGDLVGAPGQNEFPKDFRKEDYGLRVVRSAEMFGLVFATFRDDAPELADYLDDTKPYIAKAFGGDGRLKLLGYQKVCFSTNWKEYSDNDGYHGPLLHAAFRLLKLSAAKGTQFMTEHAHKVNNAALNEIPDTGFLKDHSILEGRDPRLPPHNIIISLFPVTIITRNLDVISIRYATPRSPDETEVHYAYFAHEDDDDALVRHRLRQASNLIGPSGFISLEDGAVFNRLHVGAHTPGTTAFQKGVTDRIAPPYTLGTGDEAGNLIRWEHYRQAMGFARD
jgi:anthranilate 1,2-dioxygenase large subunit